MDYILNLKLAETKHRNIKISGYAIYLKMDMQSKFVMAVCLQNKQSKDI